MLDRQYPATPSALSGHWRYPCFNENWKRSKVKKTRPTYSSFKACEPGWLNSDIKYVPQMTDEDRRRCLFVAINRATRRVFIRICPMQTAPNARRFLRDPQRAAPMQITPVSTDNANGFHRPAVWPRESCALQRSYIWITRRGSIRNSVYEGCPMRVSRVIC